MANESNILNPLSNSERTIPKLRERASSSLELIKEINSRQIHPSKKTEGESKR